LSLRGKFHFEPGDMMGFDQFDRQLRIITTAVPLTPSPTGRGGIIG
jgi:hypothetical protein